MNLRSEMILDAKLIMRDGLTSLRPDVEIDANGYVEDWRYNLLPAINPAVVENDFRHAGGSKLVGEFRGAHSSVALAVNTFGAFRADNSSVPIPGLGDVQIEQFDRIYASKINSRSSLRATAATDGFGSTVAIVSACLEYFKPKAARFPPAYPMLDGCKGMGWIAEMDRLRMAPDSYQALDAARLIKHAFGLIPRGGEMTTVLYLYWEPEDAAYHTLFKQHRSEIERFGERVAKGGPRFVAMSYSELWQIWMVSPSPYIRDHTTALVARYSGSIGSYEGFSRVNGRRTDAHMFDDD